MIILLHGDHIDASRKELNRVKEELKGSDVRSLDGRDLDEALLIQALESSSLFGGSTLVVIERLFGKLGKQPKRIEKLAHILVSSSSDSAVVLWEDREVPPSVVKALGAGARVQLFKLPVLIFQFLDALRPANTKALLTLFEQLMANEPPELVLSMMTKRVRQLIQLASGTIPAGLAGWQASRLTTQAKSFTMEKLIARYHAIGEMEWALKSGQSAFPLKPLIEQFLITL